MKNFFGFENRNCSLCLCVFVLALGFSPCLWAGEERLLFLPSQTVFEPLTPDPREPHNSASLQSGRVPYEGDIGSPIELFQWRPADGSKWGWGIVGAAFIGLGTADYTDYPLRIETLPNGTQIFNMFPQLVSDWHLGTYFSESSGPFSHRFEYLHISSHLGDELFDYVQRFIYTRECFQWMTSFRPSDTLKFYAGSGYWGHIDPLDKPFFLHGGMEFFTNPFPFIPGTWGVGYFGYDLKVKDEAGGVVNQNFQLGFNWKGQEDGRASLRLTLSYYNGNSEFGQFYRQHDEHWGVGIYFDP